jgi:DNA-binding NtrC family response regulator
MESELFGYLPGAFTGATSRRPGMVEAARTGTLFLDEVAELPPNVQAKLLRFLQEGEYTPLGATQPVRSDVRVLAATNAQFPDAIQSRRFREDLYYRLSGFVLALPALRDRREDIPALAAHILPRIAAAHGLPAPAVAPSLLEVLLAHPLPGNVRQLEQILASAVLYGEGRVLTVKSLPRTVLAESAAALALHHEGFHAARRRATAAWERDYLAAALHRSAGVIRVAASATKLSERSFRMKLKEHLLDWRAFRPPAERRPRRGRAEAR